MIIQKGMRRPTGYVASMVIQVIIVDLFLQKGWKPYLESSLLFKYLHCKFHSCRVE